MVSLLTSRGNPAHRASAPVYEDGPLLSSGPCEVHPLFPLQLMQVCEQAFSFFKSWFRFLKFEFNLRLYCKQPGCWAQIVVDSLPELILDKLLNFYYPPFFLKYK